MSDSADEQLRQLLYAASHDLQEPLRGIIAYAQLLDRHVARDPLALEYTSFVLKDALRLREILQRLLVYARAGASSKPRAINLNVPLQMALLKLAPEIGSAAAQIIHESLPEAIADEGEIVQVFENILGNALKFRSAAAPHIVISAEQGSNECTVTVRDNGLGIDPALCEQALQPFKRLHGNGIQGSGLGLAICSRILRAQQGRIWLSSDGEHGTTVSFTLPA